MNNIDKLVDLEKKIQYKFQNFGLLEMAMRHSSYANEHHMERLECNERLEFLGDAVLEVVSSEFLYKTFPRLPEGEMTKKRASLVCEPALAFCAREIDLGSFLLRVAGLTQIHEHGDEGGLTVGGHEIGRASCRERV